MKKIIKMAPALVVEYDGSTIIQCSITKKLYSNDLDALRDCGNIWKNGPTVMKNIKWPANENLWVEVEVE